MIRKAIIFACIFVADLALAQNFVVVRNETLFAAVDSISAASASLFLDEQLDTDTIFPESVFVEQKDSLWGICYGGSTFVWLHVPEGASGASIASENCEKLKEFLKNPPQKIPLGLTSLFRFLVAVFSPVVFIFIVFIAAGITRRITKYLLYQEGKLIKGVKFGKFMLLAARDELLIFINLIRWIRNLFVLILFYGMLLFIFHLYPATRSFADQTIQLTLEILRDAGIIILNVIGFAFGAAVLYIVVRVFLKVVDIIFRHYEQSDKLKMASESLVPLRNLSKVLVILLFILLFIAIIPGPGETVALVGLFILLAVVGFSVIPLLRHYIAGYAIIFRKIVKAGDKIMYENRWWNVDAVTPLFVFLRIPEGDEKAIIPSEDLISKGFIYESSDMVLSAIVEDDNSDGA